MAREHFKVSLSVTKVADPSSTLFSCYSSETCFLLSPRITAPEETTFHLLHLSLMREYIDYEFSDLKVRRTHAHDHVNVCVMAVEVLASPSLLCCAHVSGCLFVFFRITLVLIMTWSG